MGKNRMEAFSDGVLAIMVLELKVPQGEDLSTLLPLIPVLLSQVLSFIHIQKRGRRNYLFEMAPSRRSLTALLCLNRNNMTRGLCSVAMLMGACPFQPPDEPGLLPPDHGLARIVREFAR